MTSNTVLCKSETANEYPQVLSVRAHTMRSDVSVSQGGTDDAPGPHDYFDAALASCKTLTAIWYAKKYHMPLERVEAVIERDDSEERKGKYTLTVHLSLHGPLTEEQRSKIYNAVVACPIHKLMTMAEITIVTAPLLPAPTA